MFTINKVWFDGDKIFVELNDLRVIGTPINWYTNLSKATSEQRNKYELKGNGRWIHWNEINEDLSAEGFLTFSK